jgi:hypothetical protein
MKKIEIPARMKPALKSLGKVLTIAASMLVGFGISQVYTSLSREDVKSIGPARQAKRLSEISIAINERNELLIFDRKKDDYQVYADSVGQAIFNIYASRLYNQIK